MEYKGKKSKSSKTAHDCLIAEINVAIVVKNNRGHSLRLARFANLVIIICFRHKDVKFLAAHNLEAITQHYETVDLS